MLLALSVISGQGSSLGSSAYKIFDERGGSIGRLDVNDWALPDPERFVSSRHAVVRFQGGGFCLEDVSTNGTFINEPERPVSKSEPVRLKDGDRLFIGDYEILVQLIEDGARADDAGSAPLQAPSSGPSVSLGTDDPLAVIGVGAGSAAGAEVAQPAGGRAAVAQAPISQAPVAQAPISQAPAAQAPISQVSQAPAAQPPIPPAVVPKPAAPAPADPLPAPASTPRPATGPAPAIEQSARELLSALGLDPRDVAPDVAAQLGAIVRIVIQGMIEVLRARAEVKGNFRMPVTSVRVVENNPLKFSLNADDALHNLFVKRNPGYLGPLEAFREGFEDIAFHELAMLAGIRAAYQSMVGKFNPAQLEETYTSNLRRTSVLPIGGRTKLWDMYCAQFGNIEKDSEASFQLLFGEEFAKAYHKQLERLSRAAKAQKK
ncbi:MAG TPA: type VI secretion system-associated FHA domain protein TagH [Steroidobacteraceae bacterium]|nr:type VI secretion system-associated FHA domain protein TagH [Steroidobacteraceae bacterium]